MLLPLLQSHLKAFQEGNQEKAKGGVFLAKKEKGLGRSGGEKKKKKKKKRREGGTGRARKGGNGERGILGVIGICEVKTT